MSTETDGFADAVAVVGMAGRFPGAVDVHHLRAALEAGTDLTGRAVAGVDRFATAHFGVPASEAALIDPQHRIFLEDAWRAIEHWGHPPTEQPGVVGVFAACSSSQYLHHRLLPAMAQPPPHHEADYLALRAAYHLRLRGPAMATQAACAGGLVSVAQGGQSLLDFRCDAALVGGVNVTLPEHVYDPAIISRDGCTNSFAEDGEGTAFASGTAVLVLRRLEDALADGDRVHAVLPGWAVTNDGGRGAGFGVPAVAGQIDAIAEALAVSGLEPGAVDQIEGHGTATALGDAVEVTALAEAFHEVENPIGLSSLKSALGHLDAASGPAAMIKATLMVRDGIVPVQPRFVAPHEALDGTPFVVPTLDRSWAAPQVVGVSSFGVGGANAHVVVTAPPAQERTRPPAPSTPWQSEACWMGDAL